MSLELKIIESLSYSGSIYNCTIQDEICRSSGQKGLIVDIHPAICSLPLIKLGVEGIEDIVNIFGNDGINRAMLFPRYSGFTISPCLSSYAVTVYLCIPKGRKKWIWGEVHNLFWAVIRDKDSCCRYSDDTEWTMWG